MSGGNLWVPVIFGNKPVFERNQALGKGRVLKALKGF